MRYFLMQLVTSIIGSIGFALMFKVRLKYLWGVVIGSGVCFGAYFMFSSALLHDLYVASLVATTVSALSAEVVARIVRTPAIVLLMPSLIPIVPGGSLYRAMRAMIVSDYASAGAYLLETLKIGLGVASGIVIVAVLLSLTNGITKHIKESKT